MPTPEEKRAAERVDLINRLSLADNALDLAEQKLVEAKAKLANAEACRAARLKERSDLADRVCKVIER